MEVYRRSSVNVSIATVGHSSVLVRAFALEQERNGFNPLGDSVVVIEIRILKKRRVMYFVTFAKVICIL